VRILLSGGRQVTQALVEEHGLTLIDAEQAKREIGLADESGPMGAVVRTMSRAAGELIEEIRGSLDYYSATSANGAVTRVVLSGGGSRLVGFAERLAERLRVPVDIGSTLSGVSVGRTGLSPAQLGFVDPIAAVPVGLALGSAS